MRNDRSLAPKRWPWLMLAGVAFTLTATLQAAGPRVVAGTFTATTANMTPAGVNLRIQVIEWQEAGARAEAVATLAAGADATTPLARLPTVGYIWLNQSPVGYSVKYAHRVPESDGSERLTLVTDKRLGSYDFKQWSVESPEAKSELPYSVIELAVNASGAGNGNLSLAGEVLLDEAAGTVALSAAGPKLLANVKREAAKP